MIGRKVKAPEFDLTSSLTRTQGNDPVWFGPCSPQHGFDLEKHIDRNVARGDIRRRFAVLVGGR